MAMRAETAVTDSEFARALLELHQVGREIDLRSAVLNGAEAQRLIAKTRSDEVELLLHIESAASHLALPGSLHGRVSECGPAGTFRFGEVGFCVLRFETDVELWREVQFVEAQFTLDLWFGLRLRRRMLRRSALLGARVSRGLRFGLRFRLFGLRLGAFGSTGRIVAHAQPVARQLSPIIARRDKVDGQFGRAEWKRERLSNVIFQALRRDDEEVGQINCADKDGQAAFANCKRTIEGQF